MIEATLVRHVSTHTIVSDKSQRLRVCTSLPVSDTVRELQYGISSPEATARRMSCYGYGYGYEIPTATLGGVFLISRKVRPRPPPRSEGLGPPKQKTKTNPFLTVTPPLQHARVRRRRNFCGGNPQNDVFTIVFGFSSMCQDTSEDPSSGFWFWTQLCQFRDQDPNFFFYGDGF